jgi:hypothetical protein
MKRTPVKTFRLIERGAEGRIIVRRVQVEDFDQIAVGARTLLIEEVTAAGGLIRIVWPTRSGEDK